MGASEDFDAFVAHAGPGLLRTAQQLAADRVAGEDLLQAALTTTWTRWWRLRDTSLPAVEAYTRRVLVTVALREGRRRWRGERPTEVLPERQTEAYAGLDERVGLEGAMAALPARWRAVVVLRYAEDLSEADVAALLGCSIGTVKSSASRALARLREAPELAELLGPERDGRTP